MKKILVTGLIILFFILPTFSCAVNIQSNTNDIKIYKAPTTSDDNQTELLFYTIYGGGHGHIGATIQNNGSAVATDVFIKMMVTGGFFNYINKSNAWGVVYIPVGSMVSFGIKHFFGFGKITIVIVARAMNAPELSKTVTASIIGPYIRINQ
jgi:hypothetical protein